jgi:hypothetical protein
MLYYASYNNKERSNENGDYKSNTETGKRTSLTIE